MTSVVVCIATFRRPESLGFLLESLTKLDTTDIRVGVVVVDNDGDGSAEPTVERYRDRLALVYAVEREAGIPAARNRLVRLALDLEPHFVAFVDDDEWVDEKWLVHLVETARIFEADAVVGPVLPSFEDGVPAWLRSEGFFERPRFATGSDVPRARTGNAMVARSLFRLDADNFPRSLAEGEDTYFFERARRNGASIVWCDEAVAYERVPVERARVRWLLRRAFEGGATFSRCQVLLGQNRRERLVRALYCSVRVVQGVTLALPSLMLGRAAALRAVRRAVVGTGGLVGVLRPGGAGTTPR